jgi:hypothetical protein
VTTLRAIWAWPMLVGKQASRPKCRSESARMRKRHLSECKVHHCSILGRSNENRLTAIAQDENLEPMHCDQNRQSPRSNSNPTRCYRVSNHGERCPVNGDIASQERFQQQFVQFCLHLSNGISSKTKFSTNISR